MSTFEPSEDYAADIRLMTSLLEGQKLGSSHQRRYKEDKPFVHLATLLSNSGSPVIAATGSIKPSGVETIIVLSGSSSTVQHPAPFVLRPIFGLDRAPEDTAQRLQPVTPGQVLKAEIKLGSAPVPIHQHVRDLFEVFKYVHNGDVSKVDMKKWVLSRGYRKLSSRLNKIHASWGKLDLITRLRSWRPQANEVITGFVDVSAPQYAGVAQVVRTWVVVDDKKHILLSGDGASRFVGGCIASILERLREIVPKSIGEDRKLAFASEALSVLQILLDQERTKWLFTQTSLGEHLRPDPPRYVRHHPSVPSVVQFAQHDDVGAEGDEGGDQDEGEDDDEDEDEDTVEASGNDGEDFTYRYLLSLTAWAAATDYLTSKRVLPHLQDCTATLVILSEPVSQRTNHQFLLNAIDKATGGNQARRRSAEGFLLSKLTSVGAAGCRVHAEAGLMALDAHLRLHSTELTADVQKIATAFDHIGSLPIGITKKCCWACFRLAELLLEDTQRDFILPGTHGVIYPWSPPPFGVSSQVLSRLRDELMGMVVRWAIEQVDYIDASRQSLPRSEDEVINEAFPPRDVLPEEWDFT